MGGNDKEERALSFLEEDFTYFQFLIETVE
jgi:hypothetical protein